MNVATSAATSRRSAEQVQRQHRMRHAPLAPQERSDTCDGDASQRDGPRGCHGPAFHQHDGQCAEAEHRERLARHVEAGGVGVAGFGKVAVRHEQREHADGRIQPEDVAPAEAVGKHAAEDGADRSAKRGRHRPRRRRPGPFDGIGKRGGRNGQALRQHHRRTHALDGAGGQQPAAMTGPPRRPATRR